MAAAKCGALAVLLDSVGTGKQNPETGAGDAPDGLLPIPTLAISREDAQLLTRLVGYQADAGVNAAVNAAMNGSVKVRERLDPQPSAHGVFGVSLGVEVRVSVYTEGELGPNVTAHNLIAELRGSTKPDRYVVVGGHLDSWDNPGETGATDDGTGTWSAWSALKKRLHSRAVDSDRGYWACGSGKTRCGPRFSISFAGWIR